jgi:long-chain acyl-CoA synthetase
MTGGGRPQAGGVWERFTSVAAQAPDSIAIVAGDAVASYGELVARAEALGADLADAGVAPRDRVAVVLPNTADFAAAAFAVWRLGAILAPLHVQFQDGEILKYVVDCRARAMITTARLSRLVDHIEANADGVTAHAWLASSGDGAWARRTLAGARPARAEAAEVPPARDADWLALTQYSTGSTGAPKRITRTHGGLIGEFEAVTAVLGRTAADRVLGAAPFFHSYGIANGVLGALLAGSRLYAVESFHPRDAAKLIERERITGFPGVPFMYQLLAELREPADFSSLRYALSAGAPLPQSTANAFKAKHGISIRPLYGTTETGVISIEPGAQEIEDGAHSVGVPIPGVTVGVVDENGHALPPGRDGRIEVRSAHAASAYDGPPAQTEAHFAGAGFRPGDLGRISAMSGRIMLCGRDRGFINVAGNKVDPRDVEAVLLELPAIKEAVVLGVPDGASGEKVKAVLVLASPVTRTEILARCGAKLAPFKLPRVIDFRDELPRNAMGKILRKYLVD